jgi:thioester reductase-like protein
MIGGHSENGRGQPNDEFNRFLRTGMEMCTLPKIEASLRCTPVDIVADILTRLIERKRAKRDDAEVLHINPIDGVTMEEVRDTMSAQLGVPVGLEDPAAWFAAVRRDPASPLFPLVELFAEGDPSAGQNYLQKSCLGSTAYSTERLESVLDELGVQPPVFDTALLRVYLQALADNSNKTELTTAAAASS